MRKVLFLTRHFPPYVTGGASRAWQFASNFATIGWEPVVVAPPAITGMAAGANSGANPVSELHRTAPDLDASGLDPAARCALLHGQEVPGMKRPFKGKTTRQFRSVTDGSLWQKSAASMVEKILEQEPEIDLLYAQGPPLEPLHLALDVARRYSLNIMLDITAPLDPLMPQPGASRSSAAAKAEEQILLSGVPLLTPNRFLKEYFLKKYHGRLDHSLVTIAPPAYDPSHPVFRRQPQRGSNTVLHIALYLDKLPKGDLKALIAALDAWIRADGMVAGGVELLLLGAGVPELLRRTAKKPLQKLFAIDETGGIDRELEACRTASFFCAALGNAAANASIVPDRLIDSLGMGVPLCIVAPEGEASRLLTEAGGMIAPAGDAGAIMELFRAMASAASFGNLQAAPDWLRQKHDITTVMRELRGAIASQPLR
ncbi:MAG: glycosyltransferase family 4 protein [Chlorobaculum sp.]|nr:glycosyltransferase family 4 protein [Chlorobaculum sp.]